MSLAGVFVFFFLLPARLEGAGLDEPPRWQQMNKKTTRVRVNNNYAVKATTETWYSQAIPLKPGHMVFTNPEKTPLKMPQGKYAILSFIGDIVDEQYQPVPLSKVYDHHWIAKASTHRNMLCDKIQYVFGIGAESRTTPVIFPPGTGFVVDSGTEWTANIHLLRTEGLAGENKAKAVKECNECYYGENKGEQCTPRANGTFHCCGENDFKGESYCDVDDEQQLPPEENFYLRYTLSYTRDVSSIIPVSVGTFAAPRCAPFYSVLRNDANPVNEQSNSMTIPYDVRIPFAVGHMHTGALNVSMYVNDKHVCTSLPTYGTQEGVAGNEKGYLVKVSPCIDSKTGPLDLKAGDVVKITGRYWVGSHDSRLAYSDGTHLNVMAYMYLAYHQKDAAPVSLKGSDLELPEPDGHASSYYYYADDVEVWTSRQSASLPTVDGMRKAIDDMRKKFLGSSVKDIDDDVNVIMT